MRSRLYQALLCRARGRVFDVARRLTPIVAIEDPDVCLLVDSSDRGPARTAFTAGIEERGLLTDALALIDETGASRRRTFLEAGANVGATTLLALRAFGFARAVSVEPEPRNLGLLRANLELNRVVDRVAVVEGALSDHAGAVTFERSLENSGDGRVRVPIAQPPAMFGEETRPTLRVRAETVDGLVTRGLVDPADVDLLWLDVQGHEGQVLAGAESVLERGVPTVVEVWPYGLRRAGGAGMLVEMAIRHYGSVVDLREQDGRAGPRRPVAALPALLEALRGTAYTDVLLLP